MKIAITGARGTVGQYVVKAASEAGHHTIQINRTEEPKPEGIANTEMRIANAATSYEDTLKAFRGADAVIHLAAIPNPVDKADADVHSNNVDSAFNGFRAAAEAGIKRFCYASSVNAIGLAYAEQPLEFDYFPIDEEYAQKPTDAYALAKAEAELQARAFAHWFPGMKIACLRIHEVAPLKEVREEHEKDWENAAVKQLFGWVSPAATARACLAAVEEQGKWEGVEVFNIVAPNTTQETPSRDLAKKYFPKAEIREGLEGNKGFWTTDKAKRLLGWEHHETE